MTARPERHERAALLVDLDGTLADSLPALRSVLARFLAKYGREPRAGEFDALNGIPLPEIIARLQEVHGLPGSALELRAEYEQLIATSHSSAPAVAGARELLAAAAERGLPVAVVTSATTAAARSWLERVGFAPRVTAIIGADRVSAGKPSPEPYRAALRALDCDAECSLAVEDSPQGAAAASAAGVPTWVLHLEGSSAADAPGRWPANARHVDSLYELIDRLPA